MLYANLMVNGKVVGIIDVLNDSTGDDDWGNYEFSLEDIKKQRTYKGNVLGYRRKQSPWKLVYEVLKQMFEGEEDENIGDSNSSHIGGS